MHTSAHPDPDLMEYSGTLLEQAHARVKQLDGEGHFVPVLCLELELDSALHNHMHVEQPFPVDHLDQAKAAAHRLKKGMRITVRAPLIGIRLVACNAVHIHVIHEPQEQAAPCPS